MAAFDGDSRVPYTDYTRWRLKADEDGGRQTWHYLESDEAVEAWPQTIMDKYWLGLPTVSTRILTEMLC